MKKIITFCLLLILTLVAVGCDSGSDTPKPTPTPTPEHTVHMDDDGNGICDICGAKLNNECTYHFDDDGNGICDVCGAVLTPHIGEVLSGTFELKSQTTSGVDMMNAYLINMLTFNESGVKLTKVDATGSHIETGSYTVDNTNLTLKYGVYEYHYTINEARTLIQFDGTLNKKKVKMTYELNTSYVRPTDTGTVSFTDELFGDDITKNFYNYCPSMMLEGNNTMHIWYCGNLSDGIVTDYVMYRKGTLHSDGKWTFSEKQVALSKSTGVAWDNKHCCDPSVIKGVFSYGGEDYQYLMAYLGCNDDGTDTNEVGLAVAKKPEGPWVKIGDGSHAFCDYRNSTEYAEGNYWGYGQPSLVSVDKEGRVLLFYTKGIKLGTYTFVEEWNLSNLDTPVLIRSAKLSDGGSIGVLNNADFAYDPVERSIYCIKEDHEGSWYPSDGGVNWISGSNTLFYTSGLATDTYISDTLFRSYAWSKVSTIGPSQTGFPRNHNCGILTDEYGWIINYEVIPVVYTMAQLASDYPGWNKGGQWPSLHTYRVHGYIIEK